ncbi:MAG: tyrosine-type recombinase/integrase [Candidatus Obscuribacterales bacterium]|nr:tyrosine-type recombinase/integrase [Candidatus Obscuribacterales bacterium]
MNTLREALKDYVAMRRSLGFKLEHANRYLLSFISFMEDQKAEVITTKLALAWAQLPTSATTKTWASRLSALRGFAVYRQASDSRTEVPPPQLLPVSCSRMKPYLYTEEEIIRLMNAALEMPEAGVLTRRTYYCFFGLLAVSGMRPGEVIQLKNDDVDLAKGLITLRESKFGKSRLVPLHHSTTRALADYADIRDKLLSRQSTYFLISNLGTKLSGGRVRKTFYDLSRRIGLRGSTAKSGPRLQDFRHRFAIETLSDFYRAGEDAEYWLPVLSTYLGHVNITNTYWYLNACPELMEQALNRLERR